MTAIYRIFNIFHFQILTKILILVYLLVCELNMKSGFVLGENMRHFMAYETSLNLLLRERSLRKGVTWIQKDLVEELWIEQKLDHFDVNNNATWLMRYFRNNRYFQPNGPCFIFVGGEWEITPTYLLTGHMHDIAKQHNGMLYYVEHRYYGQSWPVSHAEEAGLQYLNARQALADLAHFIRQLRSSEDMQADTKIILAGASYSGSLVAWFSNLYPNLISAGWASSAPLVAKMDFYDYMRQVGRVVEHRGGYECSEQLQAGLEGVGALLADPSKATQFLHRLRVCNNFEPTNPLDRAALFNGVGNYFGAYAQLYDEEIPEICVRLTTRTSTADDLSHFIEFLKHIFWPSEMLRSNEWDWCIDLSYEAMQYIFTDPMARLSGTRQWFYQSCCEFGWFATTNTTATAKATSKMANSRTIAAPRHHGQPSHSSQHSFGCQVPLSYFQQLCHDVFGPLHAAQALGKGANDISVNIQQTNSYFGGLTAASALINVIFTHGRLDPWRAVGLQEGKNVISIADYSHTADLDSIDFDDSVEMNVAKLKVAAFLRRAIRATATTTTP